VTSPRNAKKLKPKDRVKDNGRVLTQMYEQLFPDLSDRFFFLRKSLNVSQRQLGDDCELSPGTLSRIECGYTVPVGRTLIKIGKAMGWSSDYLLGLSKRKDIER
jgi:DNA-binding XRE family transcriptional regulator